jgi:hypothetical protein
LGLEAQQKAVRGYLDGGAWEIVAEFVEVESGKKAKSSRLLLMGAVGRQSAMPNVASRVVSAATVRIDTFTPLV